MTLVTELELARALKRDQRAVRLAAEKGRITRRPDGLYDLEQAVEEFAANTMHERGHNNRSETPPEMPLPNETKSTAYAKARAGTQIYEGLLKKLRYEEKAKNLTPTADVENARFTEFRALREACFNIPSRVAALLAGESDVGRCQLLLETELRKVFDAYADGKLAA